MFETAGTGFLILSIIRVCAFWIGMDVIGKYPVRNYMNDTFFVFAIHEIILESVEKVILLVLGYTAIGMTIDFLVVPIVTILMALGLAHFVKRVSFLRFAATGGR